MILESLVTTRNRIAIETDSHRPSNVNLSPMGPRLLSFSSDGALETFELRPFDTSKTYANLKRHRQGVLHVDDDVKLFAAAAIGQLPTSPTCKPATKIEGDIITSACRAYEFEVRYIDTTGPRMSLNCEVVAVHRLRDFFGFNRAKHAVLEAAILATRINFLPREEILDSLERLKIIVEKTSGPEEDDAFQMLESYMHRMFDDTSAAMANSIDPVDPSGTDSSGVAS